MSWLCSGTVLLISSLFVCPKGKLMSVRCENLFCLAETLGSAELWLWHRASSEWIAVQSRCCWILAQKQSLGLSPVCAC